MLLERAETDWLASRNFFYNIRTNQISNNINDLIDPNYIQFHPEGLFNYLQYGYSVFGQTPIYEIRMLHHDQIVEKDSQGRLIITQKKDSMEDLLGKNKTSPKEVIDYLETEVNKWVDDQEGTVIVPTSGGFDSRLLNSLIKDKDRIHAYTYGLSENQSESFETVYAKKLCEILGIRWGQVYLGNYHDYLQGWYDQFGVSVHAHGMYQMEFYDRISCVENSGSVLSGIYGDVWAGNWKFESINHPKELSSLAKTHGMKADESKLLLECNHDIRDEYWEKHKKYLEDDNWRIIEAARTKITLISYLLRVPEYYGFKAYSPFIDCKTVSMIMNLEWNEKNRRKWQIEYFKDNRILIGEMNLRCNYANSLNSLAYRNKPLKDLDVKLLGQIIDEQYVEEINNRVRVNSNDWFKYYCAYLVMYPLQKVLELKEYGKN